MMPIRLLLTMLVATTMVPLMAATPTLPPLEPNPITSPSLPGAETTRVHPDEALMKRIHQRLRDIDGRIGTLIEANDGSIPAVPIPMRPELKEVRAERDEAWANMQAVLQEASNELGRRQPDITDLAPEQNADEVLQDLHAQIRLTIAMCRKEAFERDGRRNLEYLTKGVETLDAIDERHLPSGYRSQFRYYRIWFTAEEVRLLPDGSERQLRVERLQKLYADFKRDFPQSDLQENARWLLDMLQLEQDVADTRRRLDEQRGPASSEAVTP